MKHLNVTEIVLNKTYYAVCCGGISKIKIKEIIGDKAMVFYPKSNFTHKESLSDMGILHPNGYVNDLNIVCKTKDEANKIINDHCYQQRLEEHYSQMAYGMEQVSYWN